VGRFRGNVSFGRTGVRDGSVPRIWRSTPRISVRILDCHSRTKSFGSFFLNIVMKPMAGSSAHAPLSVARALIGRAEVTFTDSHFLYVAHI